jgi:ATP-dependent DNA helicase RecG
VLVVRIPKHKPRLPVYTHDKAWQRIGDSLVPMRPERLAAILAEPVAIVDWSATAVDGATLDHLHAAALKVAREKFKENHPNASFAGDIDAWDTRTFLDKSKITIERCKRLRRAIGCRQRAASPPFG